MALAGGRLRLREPERQGPGFTFTAGPLRLLPAWASPAPLSPWPIPQAMAVASVVLEDGS